MKDKHKDLTNIHPTTVFLLREYVQGFQEKISKDKTITDRTSQIKEERIKIVMDSSYCRSRITQEKTKDDRR